MFIAAECTRTVHGTRSAPLSARPEMDERDWAHFNTGLTKFADFLAEEDGLTLVYHHHMGTVIQTEDEIDRMMTSTGPAVKLLLDTGHLTWAGADPAEVARRYRDRIAHVHAKDVRLDVAARRRDGDWSFLDPVLAGVYTVPGDGAVDHVSVFKALPNYSGWVVIEAEQDPEEGAAGSMRRWATTISSASWPRRAGSAEAIDHGRARPGSSKLMADCRVRPGNDEIETSGNPSHVIRSAGEAVRPRRLDHQCHAGARRLDLCRLRPLSAGAGRERLITRRGDREVCLVLVSRQGAYRGRRHGFRHASASACRPSRASPIRSMCRPIRPGRRRPRRR